MNAIEFDQSQYLAHLISSDDIVSGFEILTTFTVKRLSWHTDHVQPGDVFMAMPVITDPSQFVKNVLAAHAAGAACIIVPKEFMLSPNPLNVLLLHAKNIRHLRTKIARRIFPHQPEHIVAVTGTNGKTSVTKLCHQLWRLLGYKAASLGTMGLECDVELQLDQQQFSLTSPDPFVLHQALSQMANSGITHVALEASSHGLDQFRLHEVKFSASGFTNLTQDHLDYHGTIDHYFNSKTKLFTEISRAGQTTAVLNLDSVYGPSILKYAHEHHLKIMTYGFGASDLKIEERTTQGIQQKIRISHANRSYEVCYNLAGKFQLYNVLCAVGLVMSCGVSAAQVIPLLSELKSVAGRLEYIGSTLSNAQVFIDFAHTPDALQEALIALRSVTSGRLIIVFGCGGNRDIGKRPIMGQIAAKYADIQIITDDNPRFEKPEIIRGQIMQELLNGIEIEERGAAIHYALDLAQQNDTVIIAGKGHETYQIIKDKKYSFSDRAVILNYIQQHGRQANG